MKVQDFGFEYIMKKHSVICLEIKNNKIISCKETKQTDYNEKS